MSHSWLENLIVFYMYIYMHDKIKILQSHESISLDRQVQEGNWFKPYQQ